MDYTNAGHGAATLRERYQSYSGRIWCKARGKGRHYRNRTPELRYVASPQCACRMLLLSLAYSHLQRIDPLHPAGDQWRRAVDRELPPGAYCKPL